jgi:hypothetical protein
LIFFNFLLFSILDVQKTSTAGFDTAMTVVDVLHSFDSVGDEELTKFEDGFTRAKTLFNAMGTLEPNGPREDFSMIGSMQAAMEEIGEMGTVEREAKLDALAISCLKFVDLIYANDWNNADAQVISDYLGGEWSCIELRFESAFLCDSKSKPFFFYFYCRAQMTFKILLAALLT